MERLKMSYKQAFGALYAIQKYLNEKDAEALNDIFEDRGHDYDRGLRAGRCEVIDAITRIMNDYQKRDGEF